MGSTELTVATNQVVLEAQDLVLAWGEGNPVVEGVSLTLAAGQTACLVGKSGTGKTTILHALAGLIRPRLGHVFVHGREITGQPGSVGYMLQKDLLLPNLRVVDNACLPLLVAGTNKRQAREQAVELLEEFGLSEYAFKWPYELSGGMRQRVAFARTCMQGSDVVLLDEPFSALDAITRADLRSWFQRQALSRNLSVLMITHDAQEACNVANCVYVLSSDVPSRIVGKVTPSDNAVEQVLALIEA